MSMHNLPLRAQLWAHDVFGAAKADRLGQRLERFFEEVCELLQAGGVPFGAVEDGIQFQGHWGSVQSPGFQLLKDAMHLTSTLGMMPSDQRKIAKYVYERPVGVFRQEVGGTMVTLALLCAVFKLEFTELKVFKSICNYALVGGCRADEEAEREMARVTSDEVKLKIIAKQKEKPTASIVQRTQRHVADISSLYVSTFRGPVLCGAPDEAIQSVTMLPPGRHELYPHQRSALEELEACAKGEAFYLGERFGKVFFHKGVDGKSVVDVPRKQQKRVPREPELVYLRLVDEGTDSECWMICNRSDAGAVAFIRDRRTQAQLDNERSCAASARCD